MCYIIIWKRKTIIQMQIDDYIGDPTTNYLYMNNSSHRRCNEELLGGIGIKRRKKRPKKIKLPDNQTKIDQFIKIYAINTDKQFKLPYHKKLNYPTVSSKFKSSLEYTALQAFPNARGYLKNIFQFNSMDFWSFIPKSRRKKSMYKKLSMIDVFKLEMARYKRGVKYYKEWIDQLNNIPGLIDAVQIPTNDIPDPSQYGKLVHNLGSENIRNYFYTLVNECMKYNLIDCKVIIWDGRFLESYCSKNKNKELKAFSDSEAGKYKHISKYRGVGYVDSTFICGYYSLPIHYNVFPGNRNDNIVFRKSFKKLMDINYPQSYLLLADSGPYSKKNLKLVRYYKIVPIIYARKNIKENVIKVGHRKYINIKYIPDNIKPYIKKIMSLRYKVEWEFSPAKVSYKADQMINRGIENARISIGKLKCIELLTALTAVKNHRPDLINSPTAFKDYRPQFSVHSIQEKLSESNISLINQSKLESLG
ncbi:MAG: hypothetical protein EU549_01535 [Promethearchaeota archaeon]|nr:MAG: hypothetical protein EU549_01535 [Candidatus Lokiarchaeota archaeon]